MTNAEFNSFLETLSQLVESKAKTVEEAAEIIRNAKTEKKKIAAHPEQVTAINITKRAGVSLTTSALIVT